MFLCVTICGEKNNWVKDKVDVSCGILLLDPSSVKNVYPSNQRHKKLEILVAAVYV